MLLILHCRFRVGLGGFPEGFEPFPPPLLIPPLLGLRLFLLAGFNGGDAFFLAGLRHRWDIVSDEVEVDVNPLLAVDGAATSRGVDLDFLDERIEHGVCQFGTLPVFVQKTDEAAGVRLLLLIGSHNAFQFCPALFQCRLFAVVLVHKPLVLAVRQLAQHIAFIKAFYQNIQFVYAPPDSIQFLAVIIRGLRLLGFPAVLHLLDELCLIFKNIAAHLLDSRQNRRLQSRCLYEMGDAFPAPAVVAEPAALESGIGVVYLLASDTLCLRAGISHF